MPHADATPPADLVRVSGIALALLCAAYAAVLAAGLLTLPAADQPIRDPWFTAMELLILAIAPVLVVFSVGLHASAEPGRRAVALLGVIFMALCAGVTGCVHFAVLTLGRQDAFAAAGWSVLAFSFTWPSLAYALDILAWDGFFALGALCAAAAVPPGGRAGQARRLFLAGAVLAFIGLAGIPLNSMPVRNIGIVGYALLFPLGAALLASDAGRRRP